MKIEEWKMGDGEGIREDEKNGEMED